MSFELKNVQGNVAQLEIELDGLAQHQREDEVIQEIYKAVNHVVTALGGYLSVSVNGNINPVSGETGDVVSIYITSLSAPASVEPEKIITQEGLSKPEEKNNPEEVQNSQPQPVELTQGQKEESSILTPESVSTTEEAGSTKPIGLVGDPGAPDPDVSGAQQEGAPSE